MKKYHQVLLLILSAISLLSFVFYKHEYDRLRKVMEVLDIFGSSVPEDFNSSEQCFNKSVDISPDFWHTYATGFYVYSAFKVSNEKDWSLNSIAIISKNSQTSALMKECLCALITGDATEDRFEGTIEWKEISNNDNYTTYSLTCNVPEIRGNSYLFSLYDVKSNQLNFPLHLSSELKDSAATLCVVSSEPLWKPHDLIKFIHYYSLLGVNNFYLYQQGVSDQVISTLNELVAKNRKIAIHLQTWNNPFSQSTIDLSLVQSECDLRHNTKAGLAVAMQMGHYLVNSGELNMVDFLKAHSTGPESIYEASLTVKSVCSNISSHPKLQNFKLVKNTAKKESSANLRWTDMSSHPNRLETIAIESKTAQIFEFDTCSLTSMSSIEKADSDPFLSKFSKLIHYVTKM